MSDSSTTASFYSARPSLSIEGQANDALSEGLISLTVQENTEGLYACEATVGNWGQSGNSTDFLYFDRQLLDFGKKLEVTAGDGPAAQKIFQGKITGIEGRFPASRAPELAVLAEDRFQDLRMTRRTGTYEDLSDSDLFQLIASRHSLTPQVDVTGPTYKVLAQINQSDLAFLRDRARAVDAEVWMDGDTLHAQPRTRRTGASVVTLNYGQRLRDFRVVADLAHQRTSLEVSGWDVSAKEGISYEAALSTIQSELGGGQGGSAVLQTALGDRKETIVHLAPSTRAEAQSLAEARYRTIARRFLVGHGVSEGDGRIQVGVTIDLEGLGPLFSGSYYVCEVRHEFDSANGYRTFFTVERPGLSAS